MPANLERPLMARLRDYALLMRMDKPIGVLLLLWPTMWGLWLASSGKPDSGVLIVLVLGVFLVRSAGCVINDYADRNYDPHVARTRDRPLAAGRVTEREALGLFAVLILLAFGLVLTTNALTIKLSLAAAVLAVTYPFVKRFSSLPQVYLGVAFSWGIPMAFAAQTGAVAPVAWQLMLANVFWVISYDTMYAMVDRDDDLRIGVRSTAILFGNYDRLAIGFFQLATLAVLSGIGVLQGLGLWYGLGLAAAAIFMLREQWLIRDRSAQDCFRAFIDNNRVGLCVFAGLALNYVMSGAGAN